MQTRLWIASVLDASSNEMTLFVMYTGFGLDAYVVIGREESGPHMWVITRLFWHHKVNRRAMKGRGVLAITE